MTSLSTVAVCARGPERWRERCRWTTAPKGGRCPWPPRFGRKGASALLGLALAGMGWVR